VDLEDLAGKPVILFLTTVNASLARPAYVVAGSWESFEKRDTVVKLLAGSGP
jgi:hypothetical protein